MKVESKLPFHQGKRGQQCVLWAHGSLRDSNQRGLWLGWGGSLPGETLHGKMCLLWERDVGRRICAYHGGRYRERKTCWFHRVELHVSVPWGNGFRGILRCVYGRERRAANGGELEECE